jgi:hypothetical protein
MEANRAELPGYKWCRDYAAHGSLLLGDLGAALLVMRPQPQSRDCQPDLCACGCEHDPAGA